MMTRPHTGIMLLILPVMQFMSEPGSEFPAGAALLRRHKSISREHDRRYRETFTASPATLCHSVPHVQLTLFGGQ